MLPPKKDLTEWQEDDIDFRTLSLDRLRKVLSADGPYYPKFEGSTNAYRDGYITEPPKKPRASYLFFQCSMRSFFKKRNPNATQAELMTILGERWGQMSDEEQAPFIKLAKEESAQFDKERALMEKAQKPNEVWQPLRRCLMVLNRMKNDSFSTIFLEPVDTEEFPDYDDIIDQPMDLGTVEKKIKNKKYLAPEQFARDMRRVSIEPRWRFAVPINASWLTCDLLQYRFGIIVRFSTCTDQLFGMLRIICRSSLSGCTMLGYSIFVSGIFVGQIPKPGLGSNHVDSVMANVIPLMTSWSFVTTVMRHTGSNVSLPPSKNCQKVSGIA